MKKNIFRTAHPGYILTPQLDALLLGGIALITYLLFFVIVDTASLNPRVSWGAFYLQTFVNWPHFALSYLLLYGDYRDQIFKKPLHFCVAVVIPIIIIITMVQFVRAGNPLLLGLFANLMFVLVGWHYVKQIYGVIIVSSTLKKIYYTDLERIALRVYLYSLWGLNWLPSNSTPYRTENDYYGIKYYNLALPSWMLTAAYVISFCALATVIFLGIRKYILNGIKPPLNAVIAFVLISLWYIPYLNHPSYFYLVPLFHSLQYIPFAIALRKNRFDMDYGHLSGRARREKYLSHFVLYVLSSIPLGALGFYALPKIFDSYDNLANKGFGPTGYMFCFVVFINIHHYFIDHIIWKRSNPDLGKYLIAPAQVES